MDVKRIHLLKYTVAVLATAMVLLTTLGASVYAAGRTGVSGKLYEFDKGHYEFSKSEDFANTGTNNAYGKFSVQGNFTRETDKSGVPSFAVSDDSFALFYDYDDKKLNADVDSWHLVDDKSKKVDSITLDSNIMKGALILQISTDGKNWNTVQSVTDAFQTTQKSSKAIYTCSEMQLKNGCYYRFIVAYTLSRREKEGKILVVKTDKYETKHYAEVYEFYAHSGDSNAIRVSSGQTYNMDETMRVKKFDSFSDEENIDSKDIHFGWKLGSFVVSGFTQRITDDPDNPIFIKKAGDTVTLSFRLKQNIDALNGDEKLTITSVKKVCDEYFQIDKTDFGRGTLIVRYKDYTNEKNDPRLYTDYLSAIARQEADTFIQLCEEGDYEVALDYEITKDGIIDTTRRYRIFAKFSVRNGSSMVYPFDLQNGAELTGGSMTPNGFRLDFANSHYLTVYVKHSVLNRVGNSYCEDVRANRPAKDGEKYTEPGIYTIEVTTDYAGQPTTKRIAVGTDPALQAYVTSGLSIEDFNSRLNNGFVIQEDGLLIEPTSVSTAPSSQVASVELPATSTEPESTSSKMEQPAQETGKASGGFPVAVVGGAVLVVAAVAGVVIVKKKKVSPSTTESDGGADE